MQILIWFLIYMGAIAILFILLAVALCIVASKQNPEEWEDWNGRW